MYDVVIIGAGASGLVSAVVLARCRKKVLILEKNEKIGKKLLATGNGRCNLTNKIVTPKRFHSQNPRFISQILDGYSYKRIRNFFKSIGLELIEGKEGKIFPMSLQASSVVELLESELQELGVEIVCGARVEQIIKDKGSFKIKSNLTPIMETRKVVIATGNLSAPQLGGVEDGLNFARNFGHKIVKPTPSLVQLTSPMPNLKRVAGVKVFSRVRLNSTEIVGDVLFTKYGVSGLAILDISRKVVEELQTSQKVTLRLDLMPKLSSRELSNLLRQAISQKPSRPLKSILKGFLNKKLLTFIFKGDNYSIEELVKEIKSFKLVVDGTRGYKGAEVASGGVNTREIDPKTLESKRVRGLYFAGEVLDVDGDRGGFNLHFAWVSGMRIGAINPTK